MKKIEARIRRKHRGFMIGDPVLVTETFTRVKDCAKGLAEYKRVSALGRYAQAGCRAGWVCGFTSLRPGRIQWLGPEDGYAYEVTGSVQAVLVRFWPTLKAEPVPYDGLREWREGDPAPYPPGGSERDREEARQSYQKYTDQYPRDKGGRFRG